MPTATQTHITPTRRSAIGFSLAAFAAGLTVPVLASAAQPDAELIRLCDQLVITQTELWLLAEHDERAPDFGRNHAHYEQLQDEHARLVELIVECENPIGAAGIAAVARAAITQTERDHEGDAVCNHFGEEMMLNLAEGVAVGFVWPPRPGSCSTAHWAPPMSPREIDEHMAANKARWASVDAKIKADKEIEEAEQLRTNTPSTMTDDELRGRAPAARRIRDVAVQIAGEIDAEMTRRGLAA